MVVNIFSNLEIKSINEDGIFRGYASIFDNIDLHGDIIKSGSFACAIKNIEQIKMYFQHDFSLPLGKWINITEDHVGLHVTGKIFRNLYLGNEIYNKIKNKIICGLSIGFIPIIYKIENDLRKIFQVDLKEISIVEFPANPKANVT